MQIKKVLEMAYIFINIVDLRFFIIVIKTKFNFTTYL